MSRADQQYECPFTGDQVTWRSLRDRCLVLLTEDTFAEMIAWLRDCGCEWEDLVGRTNREILLEVQRQYDGGIPGFLRDADWDPLSHRPA